MNPLAACSILGALLLAISAPSIEAATDSTAWKWRQEVGVETAGLARLKVPVETMGVSQPGLADLRLLDPNGRETAYLISRPSPRPATLIAPAALERQLTSTSTVVRIQTGTNAALTALHIATPSRRFLKAARLEASSDGATWRPLMDAVPVFHEPSGVAELQLRFAPAPYPWLRLTLDDQRSDPIPVTGIQLETAAQEGETDAVAAPIASREETAEQTRLVLALPAAHLWISAVELEIADPLFTRQASVLARRFSEGVFREEPVAHGTLHRIDVPGVPVRAKTRIEVECGVASRELVVLLENRDSPPLQITQVRLRVRPAYLHFRAPAAGAFTLLSGNARCAAPRYDLAALGEAIRQAPASVIAPGPLAQKADHQPPPTLPTVAMLGAPLDPTPWPQRKPVKLASSGVQQLPLDWEALSKAQPSLADLRLLVGTNQLPYVIERSSAILTLHPACETIPLPKNPRWSRWSLRLSHSNLPLTRLVCSSPTALFRRALVLYEEPRDAHGAAYRRTLAAANWVQTPDAPRRSFALELSQSPLTDTLFLETDNEDNPPIELRNVELLCTETRLCFKADAALPVHLYYGRKDVGPPSYDLSLVAGELLAAEKVRATLAAEEKARPDGWRDVLRDTRVGGWIFWAALLVVVVGLLVVLTRLLPAKADASPPPAA
jgi:hypothetical protein